MKCKQCNTEYEGKGRSRYCSTACKQLFYRNRMDKAIVTKQPESVTIDKKCYDKPVTIAATTNGGYRMTVVERLFYKPAGELKAGRRAQGRPASSRQAGELKAGQYNFVSLPGWACYGVYE